MKPFSLFSWINRRSYTQKFIAIGLLFVLSLTGFYPMGRDQLLRREQYGVKELEGTFYLRPLQTLLADVNAYHLLGVRAANGQNVSQQLRNAESDIVTHLAAAGDWHALYGDSLLLTNELDLIEAQWQQLRTAVNQQDKEAIEEEFIATTTQIRQLINRVGDTSFLILDPDLDTYYMMDASLLKLPELQTLLNETSEIVIHAEIENELSDLDRLQLIALREQVEANLNELANGMATSWANDATGEMRPLTEAPLQALQMQAAAYFDLIDAQLISANPIAPQQSLVNMKNEVDALLADYYAGTSGALEFGIQNRIDRFTSRLTFAIGVAAAAIALAMFVGLLLLRSISRPLQALTVAATQLGAGELDVRVKVSGEDEASRVGQAFNNMAAELQATQQQLTEQVDVLSQLTKSLEASSSISRQISTILETDQLVADVVEKLRQTFGYYHAHIYLLDEASQTLIMRGGTGEVGQMMLATKHQIAINKGLVGRAASSQQTVYVADVATDPGWLPNKLLPRTKSEAAVPIVQGKQLLGVIDVQNEVAHSLTENDLKLLESVAAQVAVALRNARLYAEIRNQADQEAMINEIGQKIQRATSVEDVIQVAARELAKAYDLPVVEINLQNAQRNKRNQSERSDLKKYQLPS